MDLYILTDGKNSKTGISIDTDSRLKSYRTHNPNFKVHAVKRNLPDDLARRIESVIKACFSHLPSDHGKEWFKTGAEHMEHVVDFHLRNHAVNRDPLAIAASDVPLTADAQELLDSVAPDGRPNIEKKRQLMNVFATSFGLGMPKHRLPNTVATKEQRLAIDINHCRNSEKYHIECNGVHFSTDDHVENFYHHIELKSGYSVAICTARVAMPYPPKMTDMAEIASEADACGLRVFRHDRWSWHYPQLTGLLLYLQKTPIRDRLAAFDISFRKWVIENAKSLEMEPGTGLGKAVEDIVHDASFPLNVTSWTELDERYLERFWLMDGDAKNYFRPAYEQLFCLWRQAQFPPCPVPLS